MRRVVLRIDIDNAPLHRECEALRRIVLADVWARGCVESLMAQGVTFTEIVPLLPGSTGSYRQQLSDPYWGVLEAAIEGGLG